MADKFVVSATGLDKFGTCPRSYWLYRTYTPKERSDWLQLGLDVHAMMEGTLLAGGHPKAEPLVRNLKALEKKYMSVIVDRELTQIVPLGMRTNIHVHRRVDVLGIDRMGIPCIVDYKTGGKKWPDVEGIVPKAEGMQAVIYTLPVKVYPADYGGDISKWPSRIDFFVATLDGWTDRHSYQLRQSDVSELLEASLMLRDAVKVNRYPRRKGIACQFCDFAKACFERPGWEDHYTPRHNPEAKDDSTDSK